MKRREIKQWIDNDEGLYQWWKDSRLGKSEFIDQNREAIERCIKNVTEGKKQAHYLLYG